MDPLGVQTNALQVQHFPPYTRVEGLVSGRPFVGIGHREQRLSRRLTPQPAHGLHRQRRFRKVLAECGK